MATKKKAAKQPKRKSATSAKKSAKPKQVVLPARIAKYFDQHGAAYKILSHRTVYTAFDTAQTLKIDPKIVAKTLIVQADRQLVIVAIPGDRNLDIPKLKKVISQWSKQQGQAAIKKVSLVTERTITNKLTKTTSAVVPVGGLYKLPTIIDTALLSLKKVVLNAGSFELSLEMSGAGLKKLAEPIVGAFSKKRT